MKIRYLIGILAVFLMLALSGCGGTGQVVAPETEENDEDFGGGEVEAAEDNEDSELTDEEKELTNKELLKKLQEEAGLDNGEDSDTTDEAEETTESVLEVKEVTIQNFKGTPDDFTIDVGTTVRWTNFMNNFKQLIVILPWDESKGKYDFKEINELEQLLYNESYEYTFEEVGDFRWGSKTKFDKINGEIRVK